MRTELLNYLTTATSTATIRCVSELPWNTAGEPLYLKNMKRLYLSEEQVEQTVMFARLDGLDVMQNQTTVQGYFAVDAKNQPANLAAALTTILGARSQFATTNHGSESDYTTEIQDDVLIYTISYRLLTTA